MQAPMREVFYISIPPNGQQLFEDGLTPPSTPNARDVGLMRGRIVRPIIPAPRLSNVHSLLVSLTHGWLEIVLAIVAFAIVLFTAIACV